MNYQDITYDVEDGAALITLNRPEKLNAWTRTMEREYRDALDRADGDAGVRAVILTGAGRGFCAGADMSLLGDIAEAGGTGAEDQSRPAADAGGIEANYQQPFSFPWATRKPLIAAINGPAAGLGLIHTLYCDIRIASEQARFGTAFARLGLIAEHGASWILPRLVGTDHSLDLLYSARVIGAREALDIGLVTRVVPHDELLPACREYVASLKASSPAAMGRMKKLVYDGWFQDLAQATRAADRAMAETTGGPEFREGLNAFAEKREPNWQGLGQ
jgi:enoyl-CoA hydratase/carnithine racemase